MRTRSFFIAMAGVIVALPALAQAPAAAPQGTPMRVRGTVEKLDGNVLMVKAKDGSDVTINLAPNFAVRGLAKKSLSASCTPSRCGFSPRRCVAWARGRTRGI
jgi:hypothetical protein